jgi:CheY-like chemotaxis protein
MSKRILIIDDNHEIVRATSLRLNVAGYETLAAYDGEQGIDAAVANQPDAIVLDVRMPVKDGLTALLELKCREETRDIPVVMLSASVVDQQAALDCGARYFVRKPHDGSQLIAALNTVIPN